MASGLEPGAVAGQPALTVELLDGLGHWVPEEAPETVVERVLSLD